MAHSLTDHQWVETAAPPVREIGTVWLLLIALVSVLVVGLATSWAQAGAGLAEAGLHVALLLPLWLLLVRPFGWKKVGHSAVAVWAILAAVYAGYRLPSPSFLSGYNYGGQFAGLIIAVAALLLVARPRWRDYGWAFNGSAHRTRRATVAILAGSFGLFAVAVVVWRLGFPNADLGSPRAPFGQTLLFQLVLVACAEEFLYRSLVQSHFDRHLPAFVCLGTTQLGVGALLAYALFFFGHAVDVTLTSGIEIFFIGRFDILVSGLVYVYLRAWTGSVWPCVLLHGLWNALFAATLPWLAVWW